jgi:NAD(P)-dependent dehydrogenase (short-subunit alcohol dehydrogenase family)
VAAADEPGGHHRADSAAGDGGPRERIRAASAAEEFVNVALFLASDESSYISGVDPVIDGGMKVW